MVYCKYPESDKHQSCSCPRYKFSGLLIYSMVQSPSWEANWFAASQEIPRISRNLKVHYCTHKRPLPVPILGQPNPVHIPTSHLLEIHSNIIYWPVFPTEITIRGYYYYYYYYYYCFYGQYFPFNRGYFNFSSWFISKLLFDQIEVK